MGAVYLAEDSVLGRRVALKLPSFDPDESPDRVERFVREARSAAVLQHPNICTVFDAGRINDRPFISMAYIEGMSLESLVSSHNPMAPRQAVELARQVALALAHAHGKGIVHRDLKPANIILADGQPVVMDFGLAKQIGESDKTEARLTKDGAVMGTPSYMAPEQVRGELKKIGPPTDVYALGVMLFELLTGQTPFNGPIVVVLGQILGSPIPSLNEFRKGLDPRLDAMCRKAMAKAPADRYQSMTEFVAALTAYLTGPASDSGVTKSVVLPRQTTASPPELSPVDEFSALAAAEALSDNTPELRTVRRRSGRRKSPPKQQQLIAAAIGSGLLILLSIVVLTFRTRYGDVVIELSDPNAKVNVEIDGEAIEIAGLDRPLSLKVGEHGLTVKGTDFETVTEKFTVYGTGGEEKVQVNLKRLRTTAGVSPTVRGNGTAASSGETIPATDATATVSPTQSASISDGNTSGFKPLIDERGLSDWTILGNAKWTWKDDRLLAEPNGMGFLMSKRDYQNFELELEFKLTESSGSGILLRADANLIEQHPNAGGGPKRQAMQVQIRDDESPTFKATGELAQLRSTGAIYNQIPRIASPPIRRFDWNHIRVRAVGTKIDVWVNDVRTIDGDTRTLAETRPWLARTAGRIVFEVNQRGNFEFKNLRIREITGPGVPASITNLESTPLLNGRDLTGWMPFGAPKWSFADGRVLGQGPGIGFLVTNEDYEDFEVELEYKLSPGAGSGLFLRADPRGPISGKDMIEVQIIDDESPKFATTGAEADRTLTGAIWGLLPRITKPPINRLDWNSMRARIVGSKIDVWVNGVRTIGSDLKFLQSATPWLARKSGRIGLQLNQPANVEFRNIQLRKFNSTDKSDSKSGAQPAISLFNGTDLQGWRKPGGGPAIAEVKDGYIELIPGQSGTSLETVQSFGDHYQLHVEFYLPDVPNTKGQQRANSGIYLHGRYEVQILDSHGKLAADSQPTAVCGALYQQIAPTVDATRPAGQWQSMDVTFLSPLAAKDGKPARKGALTVVLNGTTIIDNQPFDKPSPGGIGVEHVLRGPIILQNHRTAVRFRNIQLTPLGSSGVNTTDSGSNGPVVPDDALRFEGHLYKLFSDHLSWKVAQKRCKDMGGYLIVIDNSREESFATQLISNARLTECWIGATDEAREGDWRTVLGDPLTYSNWNLLQKQPNNKPPGEHFAILIKSKNSPAAASDWAWSDQPDTPSPSMKPGFICEWN